MAGQTMTQGNSVRQTADGGYIIAGCTGPSAPGIDDVYLIKTNADLDVGPVAILSPPGIAESGRCTCRARLSATSA